LHSKGLAKVVIVFKLIITGVLSLCDETM